MRVLLALTGALAFVFMIAACDDGNGDRPNDIPRTVPPTSVPSSEAVRPPIQGVGPIYEASMSVVLPA